MSRETRPHSESTLSTSAHRRLYRIELRGRVDRRWLTACDPLVFSSSDRLTLLLIQADQAALRGVLNHLWDLNVDVLAVFELAGPALENGGT